jgi:hypothetical protein
VTTQITKDDWPVSSIVDEMFWAAYLKAEVEQGTLIGDDGRLWDGHHRLYAAYWMGYTHVPVKYARPVGDAS